MFTFASRPVRVRVAAGLSAALVAAVVPALVAQSASAEGAAAQGLLTSPVVTAPTDAGVVLKDVVLSWGAVNGATGYKVQVGTDDQWSDDPTYAATSVGTRLTLPTWLPHASYVWRVAATTKDATSRWSSNGTFTKGWRDRPQVIAPDAGKVVTGTPTFRWSPLAEASAYEVQLSSCPTFPDGSATAPKCQTRTGLGAPSAQQTSQDQAPAFATCFTSHTELTPYAERASHGADFPGDCASLLALNSGYYVYWRVRGLDVYEGSAADVDTTPASSAGISHAPPAGNVTSACPGQPSASPSPSPSPSASATGSASPSVSPSASPSESAAAAAGGCTPTHEGERSAWSETRLLGLAPSSQPDADYTKLPPVTPALADHGVCTTDSPAVCSDVPTLTWSAVTGATDYRVYIALDEAFTNIQRIAETKGTSWTTTDTFKENGLGPQYYYAVQPCTEQGCGAASTSAQQAFRKVSTAESVVSPVESFLTRDKQITFTWRDFADSLKATNGDRRIEASAYHLQVTTAGDPDFTRKPIEDVVVDGALCAPVAGTAVSDRATQTAVQACDGSSTYQRAESDVVSYTSDAVAYPDGDLLWRVQTVDPSGRKLRWSTARTMTIDTVHPTVTMTPGSNISVMQPLTVRFSEPVVGLDASALSLSPAAPVAFAQSDSRTVVLRPTSPLAPGARYTLAVSPTVTDPAGNGVVGAAPTATVLKRADDPSPAIRYSGDWRAYSSSNAYNRNIHRSVPTRTAQTTASITVYGTGALVIGCMTPSNGYLDVFVDGKLMVRRDTYRSYSGCGIYLARVTGLAPGMHNVQVRGNGLKRSAAKGTAVAVDAIDAL